MKSDIEIANSVELKEISSIAVNLGVAREDLEPYGHYMAKVPLSYINEEKVKQSNLILVTAISPTKAGIGKTTVSIGLSMGLRQCGKNAIVVLREPSLGPCFGMKGGACGGGYSQVLPMDKINLHFTGDFHAVTSAHNMITALMDNYFHQNRATIPPLRQILWKRVLDVNDRSLRQIVTGLGPYANGIVAESGFDITPASEIMAILCLASDMEDLRRRIDNVLLGYRIDGTEFTVKDLGITGSILALLKDAMKPNLVQTTDNDPALVHGGPFANIAHGCNTMVATKMGLSLCDYVVTEAGFGADLGAEKFLDINNIIPEYTVKRYADLKLANGSWGQDGVNEEYLPHVAFVALNYDGELLCAVGNIGEKTHSLVTNFAVKEGRQVGSTIKPISGYAYGIESGDLTWGSDIKDAAIMTGEDGQPWPFNYGRMPGSGGNVKTYYALQQSYNTCSAQLVDRYSIEEVYKFSKEKLGVKYAAADKAYSPLSLGALYYGIPLENLVNAYLPYGNNGIYNEAHLITRIEDSSQQVIYQNNGNPRQAVSDETAWVMNRLLKNVVENGTGTAARLGNKVVCGKTGTTQDYHDEAFVGLTRDFVSGITIGYDINDDIDVIVCRIPQMCQSIQIGYTTMKRLFQRQGVNAADAP